MAKTLSARIAQRINLKQPHRKEKNRADFLVMRADIKQALDDGWPIKTIWETILDEGKMVCSYQAFRRYITLLITAIPATESTLDSPQPDKRVTHPTPRPKPPSLTGFTFTATPNKEELF